MIRTKGNLGKYPLSFWEKPFEKILVSIITVLNVYIYIK